MRSDTATNAEELPYNMTESVVYLDNHATTRLDPRVLEQILPYFCEEYGNPASLGHCFGRRAAEAVERARQQIADCLEADPREVCLTSGATEANNLAIRGVLQAAGPGSGLVTVAAEHPAVLDTAARMKRQGHEVIVLPVDNFGRCQTARLATALTPRTVLVSVMLASNEVGTINDLEEIGGLCRERNILLHTDAVQAVGRISVNFRALPVDLLSLSAHKLYGPKGVGALLIRRDRQRIRLTPQIDGGGHERGLRSGTLPVPQIVGFGAACALATREQHAEAARIAQLRDQLQERLQSTLDGVSVNGHPTARLPGNLNLSFAGVDGDALLAGLRRIAVSSGSACTTAHPEPSHVLRAMGVRDDLAAASLRFGLGRFNTADDIETAADEVAEVVNRLRGN